MPTPTPIVADARRAKVTSEFKTLGLELMRLLALSPGGSGLAKNDRTRLWKENVTMEREHAVASGVHRKGPMEMAFPTPGAFIVSFEDEKY